MAEVAALAGVTKMTVSRVLRPSREGQSPTPARGSRGDGGDGLCSQPAGRQPDRRHQRPGRGDRADAPPFAVCRYAWRALSDVLAEAGLGLIVSSSAYRTRCRGEPDPLDPGAPPRRARADRAHPHRRGAASSLRSFGIPVVETWESGDRAGRHGRRLFQPRGRMRHDAWSSSGPAIAGSSSSTAQPRTTSGPGMRAEGSRRRLPRPGSSACRSMSSMTRPRSCPRPARRRCGRYAPDDRGDRRASSSPATCSRSAPSSRAAPTGSPVPDALGHRRLPRSRDRPRRRADADHRARAGAGDRPQGRRR